MESLRIIALGLVAAIAYGVVHDQVTARVCVEYFTIGHPPLFPTESPTLLAIGWGVVAKDLRKPVARLLAIMAACALVSGLVGYALARGGAISLEDPMRALVPASAHARFLADLWAHSASYASGIIGGIVLSIVTYRRRPFVESGNQSRSRWRVVMLIAAVAAVHWLAYVTAVGATIAAGDYGGPGAIPKWLEIITSTLGAPLMYVMLLPPATFGPTRWWGDDSNVLFGLAAANSLVWGVALTFAWRWWRRRRAVA